MLRPCSTVHALGCRMVRQFLLLTLLPVLGFAQATSPLRISRRVSRRMARIGSATAPSFCPTAAGSA